MYTVGYVLNFFRIFHDHLFTELMELNYFVALLFYFLYMNVKATLQIILVNNENHPSRI